MDTMKWAKLSQRVVADSLALLKEVKLAWVGWGISLVVATAVVLAFVILQVWLVTAPLLEDVRRREGYEHMVFGVACVGPYVWAGAFLTCYFGMVAREVEMAAVHAVGCGFATLVIMVWYTLRLFWQ